MKAYEEEQKNKSWYQAIGEMFPAGWRWKGAAGIVWEHCTPSNWFGLKLGWDYFLATKEPEWKIALPPPLGEGYPQVSLDFVFKISKKKSKILQNLTFLKITFFDFFIS